MSGACDNFILEDQSCEWFELVQYVESFDMGINFLEGPPGPPGPAGEAIFIPSVSEDGWISWTNTAGLPNPDPVYIKGPPGGGGSGDYDDLTDKPSINGVTLSGNKTTAELLISFSAADVGLGNVANERQYSSQNPPPYPVTSVAGKTGAVGLLPSDVGLGNVANERQYSAQNPPPYPVTSVAGKTGAVDLLPSDVGLGNVANERQYSSQNPPPYPVTSVDGKAGAVSVLPIGGTAGQVLKKASATDYDVEWGDESGGGSSDYADLTNKPSINGVTLSGNKTAEDLGLVEVIGVATAFAIPAEGASVSYNLAGITAEHELARWNFSTSAENDPPAALEWTTYAGYFTITNNGGTTSESMRPVFELPTKKAATTR